MVALLEEALAGIGEGDGPLRLELLSRLAKALYYSEEENDEQRREALSSEALAMAERLGETSALLIALEGRHFALTRPENLDERLSTARRIIALAHECGDAERDLLGRYFLISDLVEGDAMEEADAELEEYGRRARAARLALHLWYHARFRAMRALLRGRLEEAAGLAQEAYELGLPVEPRTATMHFGAQMWLLNHLQRSLAPLEEAVRSFVADYPRVAAWRMGLAHVLLEQGRRDEAAAVFQEFRAERFRNIPRDAIWGVTTALAAELVAAGLGGRSDGRALYDLMRPYADRNAVTGETIFCSGPMAYYAGLMARAIGDEQEAHELLESALGRARSMGAEPYVERAAAALRESGRHAA
jgi:tetratricopeptide (TPR) repeat protein